MSDMVLLAKIKMDAGTQSRAEIRQDYVEDLREVLAAGRELPPPIVYSDGLHFYPADGHHTLNAHQRHGSKYVKCDVRRGGVREARLFSAGCNDSHGLRRTNADKRAAVLMLLKDEEWAAWSDRVIAEKCRVSADLVGDVRKGITSSSTVDSDSSPETSVGTRGKDGKTRKPPKKVLCEGCERKGERLNCKDCEKARKEARRKKDEDRRKKAEEKKAAGLKDAFGNEVPASCKDVLFDPWVQQTIDSLAQVGESFRKLRVADGMDKREKRFPFFNAKDVIDGAGFVIHYLDQLIEHLKENRPAAVCPKCQGKKCVDCRSSGAVPRKVYEETKG